MTGQRIRVVETTFPVVQIVCPSRVTLDCIRELDERFSEILGRGERYTVLTDTTPVRTLPDAVTRQALGKWWRQFDRTSRGLSIGSATVIDRPVVRSMLTAISWFHPAGTPQYYASDMDDGERWCRERLARVGVQ